MAVLRNVPKTFSFEEQRIEINEIAQDLYDLNVTASAISLSDISVVKPNPTAAGSGDVTYHSSNGQFTYTPPELNFLTDLGDAIVDGDFTTAGLMKTDGAGNYSVITDDSSDWNEAHGWGNHANAGYLTGLPAHSHSLVGLSDTSLTGGDAPSDGEALVWDQTNTTWKAGTISSGWQGNVQNSTTANGPGAISFDTNTNTLIFEPVDVDLILGDINNFANVSITTATVTDGDLLTWDQAAYKFLNKQPAFNYDGTGAAQGKTLRYNGTKWVISQDASYSQAILGGNTNAETSVQWDLTATIDGGAGVPDSITITGGNNITFSSVTGSGFTIDAAGGSSISTLNDIGDVNVGTTITDGHVLKWDLASTKWVAAPDLTSSGGSGIALTDISVVKPNPTPAGSGDVTYNSTSGAFTYTPPSIPAAQVKSDWDSTTGLSEILNKPNIVENLGDLGDVDTTGAANGKILKHNGTSWIVGTDNDSGGGGGSTSPGGSNTQVQFNDTGSFAGDASLTWDNTNNRLSIGEDANDSYLEVGKGAPGTSSTRFSIRSNNSSNYLYSYASSMFHIACAGSGGTIQLDWISGTMAHFKKNAECSLYYNNVERIQTTDDGAKIIGGIQDKDGQLGTAGQILSSTGTQLDWIDAPSGGTTDLSNYVKTNDSSSITINRTGSAYLTLHSDFYIQLAADQYVSLSGDNSVNINSSGGPLSVNVDSNIVLSGGGFVQTKGSYVDFQNVAGNASYGKFDSTGLNLYTGGIKDKDGQLGTAGQILSSTGTSLDWIDAPAGEANVQVDWTQTTTTAADYIKNKPGAFGGTASGLVPASTSGETTKFLRSDGTWQDASSGATTIDGLTDTNLNTSNLGSGQVLQHDGSKWVNAAAPSGVPAGTIVMFNSATAPSGWALCDGNNSTPDLRDKFIVGAGNSYNQGSTGGSKDAVVISHSHGTGNLSTGNDGSHSHTSGNFGTNNTGTHSHNQSGSGSGCGTTGTQSANHHHTTSTSVNTGSDGAHQHRWGTDDLIGAQGGNNNPDASGGTDWRAWTDSQGAHSHTFNFTHDTLGVSENHTHDFNFNYNIGGSTGNDGSHSHNITGNTNNTGTHSHNVTGNTSSEGSGGSDKNLPPYYALTYIMKL